MGQGNQLKGHCPILEKDNNHSLNWGKNRDQRVILEVFRMLNIEISHELLKWEKELKYNRQVWGLEPMRKGTQVTENLKGNMKSWIFIY